MIPTSPKRYCRTWLVSHFRALPVYLKRGCAALRKVYNLPTQENGLFTREKKLRRQVKNMTCLHMNEASVARRRNSTCLQSPNKKYDLFAIGFVAWTSPFSCVDKLKTARGDGGFSVTSVLRTVTKKVYLYICVIIYHNFTSHFKIHLQNSLQLSFEWLIFLPALELLS